MNNNEIIVLITGSRKFTNEEIIKSALENFLFNYPDAKFRHGGAIGADQMVSRLFPDHIEEVFEPEYTGKFDQYDNDAPKRRNIKMLETEPKPLFVYAFYYQFKSGGTLHTVNEARKRDIAVMEYIQR